MRAAAGGLETCAGGRKSWKFGVDVVRFTVHMYSCPCVAHTCRHRGVLEVGAPTRGREKATEVEQEVEKDEVERGWIAETVSRANGIVSQCATRRYSVPRVSL